jgi:hypothetical protein
MIQGKAGNHKAKSQEQRSEICHFLISNNRAISSIIGEKGKAGMEESADK